jgi:hypothetical protein
LPHYRTFLPPFEQVFPGSEATRFADVLTLAEAECPILVVGVMRNNAPKLVPLWGPALHLDPPYSRTSAHEASVLFCQDVVGGNLPASTLFNCDWLMTEGLELLQEDLFLKKLAACPLGADSVLEADTDAGEDLYVAQAMVLPGCLVPDLLVHLRNPVVAWRLLCARATELDLLERCSALWLLLQALASTEHREDSCVGLLLVDGDSHFVSLQRKTLETILPALAAAPPAPAVPVPTANATGTASLAATIEAPTRPAAQKIMRVEEKWPNSYGRLLLLVGVPLVEDLHLFWHEYANQLGPTSKPPLPPWQ